MCTIVNDREVMVCDISRDRVCNALETLGAAASWETVHGAGTRFTCVDAGRISDFQASVTEALAWEGDPFTTEAQTSAEPHAV